MSPFTIILLILRAQGVTNDFDSYIAVIQKQTEKSAISHTVSNSPEILQNSDEKQIPSPKDLPAEKICENDANFTSAMKIGAQKLSLYSTKRLHLDQGITEKEIGHLFKNGHYIPSNCTPKSKLAVVIPFRGSVPPDYHYGRDYQLQLFIHFMTHFLILQNIQFKIYVIEQTWTANFNRARLLSIGYVEAMKDFKWDCLVIQDVDRIPQSALIDYNCLNTGQIYHYMPNLGRK